MITVILIASIVGLSAIIAMVNAVRHAPEGYENLDGFHFGREPVALRSLSGSVEHTDEFDRHAA